MDIYGMKWDKTESALTVPALLSFFSLFPMIMACTHDHGMQDYDLTPPCERIFAEQRATSDIEPLAPHGGAAIRRLGSRGGGVFKLLSVFSRGPALVIHR